MNTSPLLPLDVASATFLLMTAAMAATTVLLLTSGHWVSPRWRLPVALSSLVPLVGVLHYGLSSLVWLQAHDMPVVFRYADWMIAAPVQVLTLYFFIQTVSSTPTGLFWRLLIASVAMVLARYMGETDLLYPTLGFLIGLILWLYVLGELYFGRMAEISRAERQRSGADRLLLAAPYRDDRLGALSAQLSYRPARQWRGRRENVGHLQSGRSDQPDCVRAGGACHRDQRFRAFALSLGWVEGCRHERR